MQTLIRDPRCVLIHGTAGALALKPNSVDALVTDPPSGISFMSKEWDGDRGGRDHWVAWLAEQLGPAFAALKPGGHALVWALPRTSHWTAYALEACGFEIRDRVSHLFLNGFPKSLNVGKAIDARAGAERPVVGDNPNHRPAGYTGPGLPFQTGAAELTGPATADAAAWEGWGTALKPALEDWWLVRKPFDCTVAENVLRYGTGALNIDGCRIPMGGEVLQAPRSNPANRDGVVGQEAGLGRLSSVEQMHAAQAASIERANTLGRWPAHLIVDEDVAIDGIDDPARFFYCPKPSTAERERGLEHLPKRSGGEATGREDGTDGLKNPRAGAGRGGGRANVHPTVKSVALMRWLVRLITPPGGIVLDVFAGSGTTGVAALAEGMRFVGVEQGGTAGEYLPIIEGRLRAALAGGL